MITLLLLLSQISFAAGRAPAIVGGITYAPMPANWFDLEVGKEVATTQDIRLNDQASFPAGTKLFLEDREPLGIPYSPVTFFTLHALECANPEWESVVEMVTPAGSPESAAAGVELSQGCNWGIYVEDKDLMSSSFLGTLGEN